MQNIHAGIFGNQQYSKQQQSQKVFPFFISSSAGNIRKCKIDIITD